MTRLISGLLLPAILLGGAGVAPAQTVQSPAPKPEAPRLRAWRLVDVWWNIGKEQAFESLGMGVTISDDLPSLANLTIAPIGLGHLNETPFRGAFQTHAHGDARNEDRPGSIRPGLIFTLLAERSIDAARASAGGLRRGAGAAEGSVSVVRPYAWTKGRYTYKIRRTDGQVIRGKPFTWVLATVVCHDTHDEVPVGSLRFPGDRLILSRQMASFVEISTPDNTVEEPTKLSVALENLEINGKPVEKVLALAEYPDGAPDIAVASGRGNGALITLGPPIRDRKKRRVDLLHPADRPASQPRIGKFELLATYTYARALRDGLTENASKERGITAAVMGARARGLSRASSGNETSPELRKGAAPTAKKKTLTALQFDQQVAHKLEPFFEELLLPWMKQLVATGLSYEKLKDVLEMPADVGAKISAEVFEQRVRDYLKRASRPEGR